MKLLGSHLVTLDLFGTCHVHWLIDNGKLGYFLVA